MSRTPQSVRGTQSLIGEAADRLHRVINAFKTVRDLFGFGRVEVPVFEHTAVFARSLGETTDVVSKEMYTFPDRSGESLTLRPEFTAGIARAYLSEGWRQYAPLKLATHGPAFRYERPQKGRFRQFHQVDVEVIGAAEPAADVEVIAFADQLLRELGLSKRVQLQLNTLGDAASREAWRAALVEHFRAHADTLSEQSRARLEANPLRILDSKEREDRPIVDGAPEVDAFLTGEAQDFFGRVTAGLDAAGIAWARNPRLVRGLDYYRHTAFEFVTTDLGSQGTVIGGGRYDGLIEAMGGPHTPAVGWAGGMERMAMLIDAPAASLERVVIIADGDESLLTATWLASHLRQNIGAALKAIDQPSRSISFELAFKTNERKQLEKVRREGADLAVTVRSNRVGASRKAALVFNRFDKERARQHHRVSTLIAATVNEFVEPYADNPLTDPLILNVPA